MDYYMDYRNVYQRLENEYKKYGKLIILVDYDDTLYDTYKRGETYSQVIELIRRWAPYADLIIWTVSTEDRYPQIEADLKARDIPYDGINRPSPLNPYPIDKNTRKIYCNAQIDDRCGIAVIYSALLELITKIEAGVIVCSTH